MSQEHRAFAFYGIYFDSLDEIEEFLVQHNVTDCDEQIRKNALGYECLNAFSGNGWVLGVGMELGIPIQHYVDLWTNIFPKTDKTPEATIEVKTY
jgi:hypothetical protein